MAMQEHVREHRPDLDADIPEFVWRQEWVVHVQPAGCGQEVLKYLARYVSRSAIGPSGIVSDDERGVTYRYTESGSGLTKYKTLPADDFIQRVLRHALPKGFRRIRYYGWLHLSAMSRLLRVQTLLRVPLFLSDCPGHKTAPAPCPHCGGVLERRDNERDRSRSCRHPVRTAAACWNCSPPTVPAGHPDHVSDIRPHPPETMPGADRGIKNSAPRAAAEPCLGSPKTPQSAPFAPYFKRPPCARPCPKAAPRPENTPRPRRTQQPAQNSIPILTLPPPVSEQSGKFDRDCPTRVACWLAKPRSTQR